MLTNKYGARSVQQALKGRVRTHNPVTGTTSFTYDKNSNLTSQRKENGSGRKTGQNYLLNRSDPFSVPWPLADNLGSNRDVVRRDAIFGTQPVEHLRFDAFGEILDDNNAAYTQRQTYAGLELDADVGLYYALNRWYDPFTHRFISEDPIGFNGGDYNLGRYVGNSPVSLTDPSGLDPWWNWNDCPTSQSLNVVIWDSDDSKKAELFAEVVANWKKSGKVHIDIPVKQADTWSMIVNRLKQAIGTSRIGTLYILDDGSYPNETKGQQIGGYRLKPSDLALLRGLFGPNPVTELYGCNLGLGQYDQYRQDMADITDGEVRGAKNFRGGYPGSAEDLRPKDYNANKPLDSVQRTFPGRPVPKDKPKPK